MHFKYDQNRRWMFSHLSDKDILSQRNGKIEENKQMSVSLFGSVLFASICYYLIPVHNWIDWFLYFACFSYVVLALCIIGLIIVNRYEMIMIDFEMELRASHSRNRGV